MPKGVYERKPRSVTEEVTPPRTQNGGHRLPTWGQIVEVEITQIPQQELLDWWSLFEELCLRLENTPKHKALSVPFDAAATSKQAAAALRQLFEVQIGAEAVTIVQRSFPDGRGFVYVTRGDRWQTLTD